MLLKSTKKDAIYDVMDNFDNLKNRHFILSDFAGETCVSIGDNMICPIEKIPELVEQLTSLKHIIEQETGVYLF